MQTIFSFLALLAVGIAEVVQIFTADVSMSQMVRVLQMPNGWYCTAQAVPFLMRASLLLLLRILLIGFFCYYFVSRYIVGNSGDDYDEWRLRQAKDLTRRLATPIDPYDLPTKPKPYLNFLFELSCCRSCSRLSKTADHNVDDAVELRGTSSSSSARSELDLDDPSRDIGLLSGERGDRWSGFAESKPSKASRTLARLKEGLRETAFWLIQEIKDRTVLIRFSCHFH